jgi:hypothetical protein
MLQKIKNHVIVFASVFAIAVPALVTAGVGATVSPTDIGNDLCTGSNFSVQGDGSAPSGADCSSSGGSGKSVDSLLKNVVNIVSAVVGVIAVIMIIVGGLRYITSGGDTSKVSGAKNTLLYAIIGLVIVALAQIIVHFVLSQSSALTGGGSPTP